MTTPAYEIPTYVRGSLVESDVTFMDITGTPRDPITVVARVYVPGAVVAVYTYGTGTFITKSGTGTYYVQVDTTPANGRYLVRWESTGVVQAAFEDVWLVTSAG
jgi:hypothetical protein